MFVTVGFILISSQMLAQWDQYSAKWEGKAGIATLNMDWKLFAPVEDLPYLLSTQHRINNCRTDGFADDLEFTIMENLSAEIEKKLSAAHRTEFVGTLTSDCIHRNYFYLGDTIGLRESMDHFIVNEKLLWFNIIEDVAWKGYLEFLFPSPYLYETMSNERVLRELVHEGVELNVYKPLKHYAGFISEKERNSFKSFVLEQNFKIESTDHEIELEHPYLLIFSRSDKLNLEWLSELTLKLSERATYLNGIYDGWEVELK